MRLYRACDVSTQFQNVKRKNLSKTSYFGTSLIFVSIICLTQTQEFQFENFSPHVRVMKTKHYQLMYYSYSIHI